MSWPWTLPSNAMVPWIWAAGVVHLAIVAANFALPRRLRVRENAARLSPIGFSLCGLLGMNLVGEGRR